MRRTYYTEYVAHAMRFYARNQHNSGHMDFRSEAEMLNWNCCTKTLLSFEEKERTILLEIYQARDTFEDNIYQASLKHGMPQEVVWRMNDTFIKRFAKNRVLV